MRPTVDVMQYLWTHLWPENRAPAVLSLEIEGFSDRSKIYLESGRAYQARVTCYDWDYDVLTFEWDIRAEVEIPENSYAGGMEKAARPIAGLIKINQGSQVQFVVPPKEGHYRLFVQVSDGRGSAGYANVPFCVKP